MKPRRLLLGAALGLFAAVSGTVTVADAAETPVSRVDWHACPQYSDEVLRMFMFPRDIPGFRKQWARVQCGKVSVPLDYRKPRGRHITVAVTKLPATDPAHRKGSIAFNPGGPGGSGYLMPTLVTVFNPGNQALNKHYDLIGFDPRGVGYSTRSTCRYGPPASVPPGGGPITKAQAQEAYDETARKNAECARSDAAFLGGLTTTNVARDLDRIRSALGERRIGFYGGSWGSWLGAVYRSEFPRRTSRFWLDSAMPTRIRMDRLEADGAKATARNFSRMAAWMAERHKTYGFGTSGRVVEAAIARLVKSYDAAPRRFSDIPERLDGVLVSDLASRPSPEWPRSAHALRELRDATGPTAPPAIKDMYSGPQGPPPSGPDVPQGFNMTMAVATLCNEDEGPRDFASWWAAYQDRQKRYPVTGRFTQPTPLCAGWPLPVRHPRLKHSNASAVISGHRYESVTPYEWSRELHSAIGGSLQTVGDDIHGGVLDTPECAAKLRDYFATGRAPGHCKGLPEPTTTTRTRPMPSPSPTDILSPLTRRL
ncbi:alpha/beta fold hydrolase [Thermomonospora umbrina]|uniref:TAP-like protein n=1 Tax=Thermomonospora umbrina TaxID=111806 RepID=A0A3D9SND9_9ACTN|nr:alpha/beta fold hydrolase [Thermomonospora umbrina]REE97378.1 TAP-like protein [Thermomonospora umbrina]